MSGQDKGFLNLKQMDQMSNQVGLKTPVLSYKIPRSEVYMLMKGKPFNLFITTREQFTHNGNGEQTFDLEGDIIDSASLSDDLTAIACRVNDEAEILDLVSINYKDNQVTVNHNTEEDIYIYYLFTGGNVSIDIVAPFANGSLMTNVFDNSLLKVHSVNQYNNRSIMQLNRTFIVPETFLINVNYDGDTKVYWHPNNKIGDFVLPYRVQPRKKFPGGLQKQVLNEMVSR